MTLKHTLQFAGIMALMLVTAIIITTSYSARASSPQGTQTLVATSSSPTVTTTASLVFATSTCTARVISTGQSAVRITFSDVQGRRATSAIGHWQPASTTVIYDATQVGCDAVYVYSLSSQTIDVSESGGYR